jgi:hypothetical protein
LDREQQEETRNREKCGIKKIKKTNKEEREKRRRKGTRRNKIQQNLGKPVEHELYPAHNELSPSRAGVGANSL